MAFSNELLMSFCEGFLGYGNPKAPLSYIAMEEGGGKAEDEVVARVSAWERRGRPLIDDIREFCEETHHPHVVPYGTVDAPRSLTWQALIRDQWTRERKAAFTLDDIELHQRTKWLSSDGDACLVNLLPLPSPGTGVWLYKNWPSFPWRTRAAYKEALLASRIKLIRDALTSFEPSQVVFASESREHRDYWDRVVIGFSAMETMVIPHPNALRFKKKNAAIGDDLPRLHNAMAALGGTPSCTKPESRRGFAIEREIIVRSRRGAASGEIHAAMSAVVARSAETLATVSNVLLDRVIEHCRFCAPAQPRRGWHRPIYIWQGSGWVLAPNVRIEFR